MTRPTKFGPARPQNIISIGGDPDLPAGQPTTDCCADPEDMPDRALDTGSVFVGIQDGDGSLVQSKIGTDAGGGSSLAFDSDTVAGNLLACVLVDRGGTTGPFSLSGWTFIDEAGKSGASEVTMFWRVAPGGPVTVTFNPPTNEVRIYLMEFAGGAAGLSATPTTHDGGASVSSFPVPSLTVSVPSLLVGTVEAGDGVPNTITYTEDADFTNVGQGQVGGALSPESIVGYRVVAAGSYDYNPTGNNNSTGWGGILAAFTLGTGWGGGGPNATDGDDATYIEVTGENVLRIDLGAPFEIARVRLLIGSENSGAKSYTLKGANQADFSDAVTVTTLAWTATGSFTGDEVTDTWTPTDAYQYWELTGDDETRYVYSFELYEAGASDASAVAAALDDHITDPTDAHDASAVSIVDSGAYFTGTDVEAALQELGAASGGSSIYYNVLDYGAVGDNSTDDTTAIQDAVDAADAAGGGTVFFPHGGRIYKITSTIVNAGPILYLGEGGAGLDNPGPQVHMATSNTTAFRSNGDPAYSTGFRNLVILGPGSASSGSGIYGNNRNIFTHQVRVQGFYNGIRIGPSSYYSKLWQTFVLSNANADILLESGANNVELHACRIDSAVYGIRAEGVHGLRMYGGSMEGNTYAVYGTTGNQAIHLAGVYFESNTTSDIYFGVTGSDKSVLVEGCLFTTLGTTRSIDANNVDRLTIVGCFWDAANPATLDIRTQSATTYVQLANNTYSGAGTSFAGPVRDLDPSQSVTPVAIGTAAAGTSRYYANASHVHATGAGTPSTQAIGDSASTGSGPAAAMTDHKHAMPAFGSPVAVGAANADGSASTIARSDHVHQDAASSGATVFIGQETRTADGSTTTWLLDNDFEPDSVQAFNLTSGLALTVTEGTANSVTISAAGTAGNTLSFAYAPVVM